MSVDSIRQAVDLARAAEHPKEGSAPLATRDEFGSVAPHQGREVHLDAKHLEENRIVAFGGAESCGRSYDMMRTQILQEMDKKNWQFLAVTSATPGCGKSVTACNLALSIARLPERQALLVDLDLHKPAVRKYLGLPKGESLIDVLYGNATLASAVVKANFGPHSLSVLQGAPVSTGASEWMASQTMADLLLAIKRDFRSSVVIFDLPPILVSDDVISILPRMDAVVLVAGVGSTTTADLKECQKHLQRTPVARVVVNKANEKADGYYAGYY